MKRIDAYQTEDGDVFAKEADARAHEGEGELRRLLHENVIIGGGYRSASDMAEAITGNLDAFVSALLNIQAART